MCPRFPYVTQEVKLITLKHSASSVVQFIMCGGLWVIKLMVVGCCSNVVDASPHIGCGIW